MEKMPEHKIEDEAEKNTQEQEEQIEQEAAEDTTEKKHASKMDILMGKIRGRKYGRMAMRIHRELAKNNHFTDGNIKIEREAGEAYYDGSDPDSYTVYARESEDGDFEEVLSFEGRRWDDPLFWLNHRVGRFNSGEWTEELKKLDERAKKKRMGDKALRAAEQEEKFSPKK